MGERERYWEGEGEGERVKWKTRRPVAAPSEKAAKISLDLMAKDEEDDLLPDKDAAKGFYAKYEPKEILGR